MVENLKIEGIKDYPIKWICNFRGQKAIGICGYSQKIAMFAADSRVSKILEDIVIGTKEELEGYGCEEKDRCCNFECEFCEINPRQYLQITGKKPSNKNIFLNTFFISNSSCSLISLSVTFIFVVFAFVDSMFSLSSLRSLLLSLGICIFLLFFFLPPFGELLFFLLINPFDGGEGEGEAKRT